METIKHKVQFKISLSNGETLYENKGPLQEIPNEKSPWQKAIDYTISNNCVITSLSLFTEDGHTFNLPSLGKNPKFREFANLQEKPIDFNVSRKIATERNMEKYPDGSVVQVSAQRISEHYTIAEAIYSSYSLQLWVDELDPRNSWVLVV